VDDIVEKASGCMIYMPSFMKFGTGVKAAI
jgi:hypothetical protein